MIRSRWQRYYHCAPDAVAEGVLNDAYWGRRPEPTGQTQQSSTTARRISLPRGSSLMHPGSSCGGSDECYLAAALSLRPGCRGVQRWALPVLVRGREDCGIGRGHAASSASRGGDDTCVQIRPRYSSLLSVYFFLEAGGRLYPAKTPRPMRLIPGRSYDPQ
ncbi:hypothetical protein VUR80DRAFT_1098 [Thermomyces stellatus]